MEIITKQFELYQMGPMVSNQFLIDEDYNVPDIKRDVKRIVTSEGKLKVEEVKPVENYLHISGNLEFQILYEADGMEPSFSCMKGKFPFHEMIYLEGGADDSYTVKEQKADMRVQMIHSRKVRVKAVCELAVQSEKRICEEIPVDVNCECKIYKKQKEMELLKIHTSKKDTYRIKEEITIAGTKESMENILWTDISNCRLDTRISTDEILMTGELSVFCFYEAANGKLDWIEQTVPYSGKLECYGIDESMYHHIQADLENVHTEIHGDEDGELRIISIEGTLQISLAVYEEEKVKVLHDLYSLQEKCILDTSNINYEQLILQNHSKCKVMERLTVPELQNQVLQICHSSGKILVENMEQREDGVLITGVIYVNFLYVKSNDESPFEVWSGMIPFSHLVECNCGEEVAYDISANLEQVHVTLQGGNEIEVKAILTFQGFFRKKGVLMKINRVRTEPISMEEIERRPSIVGYIAKENDDLWTLAKNYSTSVETICEINDLQDRPTKKGERLLIFKENMSIL